jgi:hypothetical protein
MLRLSFPTAFRTSGSAFGMIDQINRFGYLVPDDVAVTAIPRGSPMYVTGWVVEPDSPASFGALVITIDDAYAAEARVGLERPDVSVTYGPAAMACGFAAVVPTHAVALGEHVVGTALLLSGGTYSLGPSRTVSIVPSGVRMVIGTPLVEGMHVKLDALHLEDSIEFDEQRELSVPLGSTFVARGWAMDVLARQPCAGVYAVVDDEHVFRGRYDCERVDVSESLEIAALRYSGFEIRIDSSLIGLGDHLMRIGALSADGSARGEGATCTVRVL